MSLARGHPTQTSGAGRTCLQGTHGSRFWPTGFKLHTIDRSGRTTAPNAINVSQGDLGTTAFGRQVPQRPVQGIEQCILLCGGEFLVIFNHLEDFLQPGRIAAYGDAPVKIIQGSDRFLPRNSVKMQDAIGEPSKCG